MVAVQGFVQYLWGHVALGAHACVRRNVHLVGVTVRTEETSVRFRLNRINALSNNIIRVNDLIFKQTISFSLL